MSLENEIKRVADVLEAILLEMKQDNLNKEKTADKSTPQKPAKKEKKVTPKPPVKETPAPPPPVAVDTPAPPSEDSQALMTDNELNLALQEECKRLGGQPVGFDKIVNLMKDEFGTTSISNLTPEQYQPLITAVKGLS